MLKQSLEGQSAGNVILNSLDPADFASIAPLLRPISFQARRSVAFPTRERRWVLFPTSGLVSVLATDARNRHWVEAGLVGREGVLGVGSILGGENVGTRTFVHSTGTGGVISGDELRTAMAESSTLRQRILAAAHTFMVQVAGSALASCRGTVHQRVGRWLLMAHDRVRGSAICVTHGSIAFAIGVRRAGVTIALSRLETMQLVSASRARIEIRDPLSLEAFCNGIYGFPEEEYGRVLLRNKEEEGAQA
jgi:CRP-like cAMP-binding protein